MSEFINNRESFEGVTASEISEAEGALLEEGLPIEEIQKLCDVHATVFKGSIEEIPQPEDLSLISGHPVNIIKLENRELERIIKEIRLRSKKIENHTDMKEVLSGVEELAKVGIHYKRKENLLFPYMEKHGIMAPPKVMWGVDDEIRVAIKEVKEMLSNGTGNIGSTILKLEEMLVKTEEMIFKEENIMIPMLTDVMTLEEWKVVASESIEIGFIIDNVPAWKAFIDSSQTSVRDEKDIDVSATGTELKTTGII